MIDFVLEEMNKSSINHFGEYVASWQRNNIMTNDEILSQPFKAIKQLNLTRGRTLVLKNWEKLIRHPDFIYQQSIENWRGFSLLCNSKYSGKYNIIKIVIIFFRWNVIKL